MVSAFETHESPSGDASGGSEHIRVGGAIKSLALDPKGQRLVVGFDDDSSSCADISLLAVYVVNTDALFRAGGSANSLIPLGYIRGPAWGSQQRKQEIDRPLPESKKKRVRMGLPTPSWFAFAPNFEPGALLAVAWANGKLSFVPMLFNSSTLSKF
ncbi:hypothetical protein IWW38_003173 [Coemansia aciculifera]|uniref:Uncharacterized protein n=1 Tax=Coemansia aciculifera TaxID=417176 RepID=A0ACC1M216_9FUNG|nr:hypothetical protein IWW38_003173 [Coemansia aciculifera]